MICVHCALTLKHLNYHFNLLHITSFLKFLKDTFSKYTRTHIICSFWKNVKSYSNIITNCSHGLKTHRCPLCMFWLSRRPGGFINQTSFCDGCSQQASPSLKAWSALTYLISLWLFYSTLLKT